MNKAAIPRAIPMNATNAKATNGAILVSQSVGISSSSGAPGIRTSGVLLYI